MVQALATYDPEIPTIVEAESSTIGQINLPPSFFAAMKSAPRITIEAKVEDRARYLVEAYADTTRDRAVLAARLDRLVRLQGRETVARWKDLAGDGRLEMLAADLITRHYDPRYARVRARVGGAVTATVAAETLDEAGREALSDRISEVVNAL